MIWICIKMLRRGIHFYDIKEVSLQEEGCESGGLFIIADFTITNKIGVCVCVQIMCIARNILKEHQPIFKKKLSISCPFHYVLGKIKTCPGNDQILSFSDMDFSTSLWCLL